MSKGVYTELFGDVFTLFRSTARAAQGRPDFDRLAVVGSEVYQKWKETPQKEMCLNLLDAVYKESERLGTAESSSLSRSV